MNTIFEVAKDFQRLECIECVSALDLKFTNGKILRIDVCDLAGNGGRASIIHDSDNNFSISHTGLHYGFLYKGKVYDNLTPKGIDIESWLNSFSFYSTINCCEMRVSRECLTKITSKQFLSEIPKNN